MTISNETQHDVHGNGANLNYQMALNSGKMGDIGMDLKYCCAIGMIKHGVAGFA